MAGALVTGSGAEMRLAAVLQGKLSAGSVGELVGVACKGGSALSIMTGNEASPGGLFSRSAKQ
jgi:hypothetical protein